MKTYEIYVRWESTTHQETITGNLGMGRNYYQIKDEDGKMHYYPMNITMISEK